MGFRTGTQRRVAGRTCLACLGAACALIVIGLAAAAVMLVWGVRRLEESVHPKVTADATTSASFPARDVKTIRLDVKVGDIRIQPGAGDQVTVEAKRHGGGPTREAVNRYLTISHVQMTNANGTLTIEDVPADDHQNDIARTVNRGLDVTLRVPSAVGLVATTGVGSVSIAGPVRDLSAESGVGTITFAELQPLGDTVRAHSGTGSVHITVRSLPRRALTADTGVGSVDLAIPADSRASVHLSSGVGGVESDFQLKQSSKSVGELGGKMDGDLNGGGPEVRATSGTGSISLRKG